MASSSRILVESELLCYVQNNFWKFQKAAVVQTIVGFYNEDKVLAAKTSLFEFVSSLSEKPDGVPTQIGLRRQNDSRKANAYDDLMKLYDFLDAGGVTLPTCAAENLSRLPPVSPRVKWTCTIWRLVWRRAAAAEVKGGEVVSGGAAAAACR